MAKFRQIHTTFWQDPKILEEMTPEDKYFYLYLLTNPNTTQIGVYQITRKQMAFDLGYSTESINSLLERFINMHKVVKYNDQTRELAIINWGKYNLHRAGKPVIDCVRQELKGVKDRTLLWEVMNNVPNQSVVDEFSRYVYDTSTPRGQEEEKEEEVEKEEEQEVEEEKRKSSAAENPFDFFQSEGFGVIGPYIADKLNYWSTDLSEELVVASMKLAVERGKKNWSYCETILKSWAEKGIRTIEAARAEQKAFIEEMIRKRGNGSFNRKPIREEKLPGWFEENGYPTPTEDQQEESKDYDFEAEKAKLEAELQAFRK
jgi:DnaD/phage-associated family protein